MVIHKGAVSALQIRQNILSPKLVDFGVVPGYGQVVNDDGVVLLAAHGDAVFGKRVLLDHLFVEGQDQIGHDFFPRF